VTNGNGTILCNKTNRANTWMSTHQSDRVCASSSPAPQLLLRVDSLYRGCSLICRRRNQPFAGIGAKRVRQLLVLKMSGGDPGDGSSPCSCRDEENNWRGSGNIDSRQPPLLDDFWGFLLIEARYAFSFVALGVCFCSEIIIEAMSLRF
jgi:hypothetical protein